MSLLFKFHGFLEVMDSKNSNNQNVSNNNTPTVTLPIFPAMLLDTKGQESMETFKDITGVS